MFHISGAQIREMNLTRLIVSMVLILTIALAKKSKKGRSKFNANHKKDHKMRSNHGRSDLMPHHPAQPQHNITSHNSRETATFILLPVSNTAPWENTVIVGKEGGPKQKCIYSDKGSRCTPYEVGNGNSGTPKGDAKNVKPRLDDDVAEDVKPPAVDNAPAEPEPEDNDDDDMFEDDGPEA
uniref:Secreted protein n=1 Tax=Romanomermis culicivorax TaxID=13658 RepID=A0A915HT89_ROMCU